ncbi:MAG: NAD(P)/FAD-dependent oxidoreductase [Bacteroidota bacterium]|nr:NAD(P)/FAD-dependent oxidoreductase [Bacteroidota bacterium]MDP4230320.1 NAD(P)/FAD-dependent oxidoreductase [Bacteroidota bacterium]MDP4235685.1 NAD(P)/FAD-dependent oxidoreductase [Bacteroidota bacterium]
MAIAAVEKGPNTPSTDEIVEIYSNSPRISRRQLLKGMGGATAMLAVGYLPAWAKLETPARIVIVGGGIAGLNAAYRLRQAGIASTVYEGSSRTGGRIFTVRNVMGPGLTTEFGGEFIDTAHRELFSLIDELGLKLSDRKAVKRSGFIPKAYFFGGSLRSESEIIEGLRPVMARIRKDAESLPNSINFENPSTASALDNTSLSDYFHTIGLSGWLKDLLEVAYVTEYGLDLADQSALNFVTLVGADLSSGLEIFGSSDERYKVQGGNGGITEELAAKLGDQIRISHKLESVKSRGVGYTLTFDDNGSAKDVEADIVIMTIPFSVLRNIDMKIELPKWKRNAIDTLGYGTGAKVMTGFTKRFWLEKGYSGEIFSDENFQLAWDNSEMQEGEFGGLTSFTGGKRGLAVGEGTVDFQSDEMMTGIEKIFPGSRSLRNGNNRRFHWPSNPFSKGCYASYKPGQWTTIRGAESKAVGNLFFAGEHCSLEFQGFMNGGAESGREAAKAIIEKLK